MDATSSFTPKRSLSLSSNITAERLCGRPRHSGPIDGFSDTDTFHVIPHEEFKRLGNFDQKKYYDDMCKALSDRQNFEKCCPRIDMAVLRHFDKNNRLSLLEQEAFRVLQGALQTIWNLAEWPSEKSASGHAHQKMSETVRWYDEDLQWNAAISHFEFELPRDSQRRYSCVPDDFQESLRQRGFGYHISSSLLWYRLTIFTGQPEDSTSDGYKSAWNMTFYHMDGVSNLRLWDSKGGTRATFAGLKGSQDDGLEFLNFLTMYKFPHTYDMVVAGTVA